MPERERPQPGEPASDPVAKRREAVRKALERHAKKLARKVEALRGDLAEANRAPEWRRFGEALLAHAHLVPPRTKIVSLDDPRAHGSKLEIELDPAVSAPANAARYFKRAAKGERGQREIPQRIEAVQRDHDELKSKLADAAGDDEQAHLELERVLASLSASTREALRAPEPLPRRRLGPHPEEAAKTGRQPTTPAPKRPHQAIPAKLVPWRFRSKEGWDVLIGRSSEANDHLTLHMARPEDYWFHVHGGPGSHVVLRRGKGANEPSKATLLEVASWAAFHSKSRTAGKVPVIYTQKKYVRKPRGAKAGTVIVEREKMLMVRPVEPPKEQMADAAGPE
jgi:predicted ribosome quality control (RQC) complex YloA/Tae2 family protein